MTTQPTVDGNVLTFAKAMNAAKRITCPTCEQVTKITGNGQTAGTYQFKCSGNQTFTLAALKPQFARLAEEYETDEDLKRAIMLLHTTTGKATRTATTDAPTYAAAAQAIFDKGYLASLPK